MAATVRYSNEKSSFLFINEECLLILGIINSDQISDEIVEITFGGKSYIFPMKTSSYFWSEPLPIISMNSVICQTLGIFDGAEVQVRKCESASVTKLNKVIVDPWNEQDWDILESNQFLVQNSMLNQVRIVQKGVPIVVFCQNSPIILSTVLLEPNVNYGQIVDGCEIFISPKDWQRSRAELPKLGMNANELTYQSTDKNSKGFLSTFFHYFENSTITQGIKHKGLQEELEYQPAVKNLYRMVPLEFGPERFGKIPAVIYYKKHFYLLKNLNISFSTLSPYKYYAKYG